MNKNIFNALCNRAQIWNSSNSINKVSTLLKQNYSKSIFTALQNSDHGKLRGYTEIYDYTRVKNFNCERNETSYVGECWSLEMVNTTEIYLKEQLPSTCKIKQISKQGSCHYSEADNVKQQIYHKYLTINFSGIPEKKLCEQNIVIVDVLYRRLFMLYRGYTSKFNSPYAQHLFETLPPIFIGTVKEMQDLCDSLKLLRTTDPLHANDDLGDTMRWFRDPLVSSPSWTI